MHDLASPSGGLLRLRARSLSVRSVAVALGIVFLAIASWIEVPMLPVPMTMQTFAVTIIGAFYGWRLGALTVLAWLGAAAVGLPVLAGFAGGPAPFMGPTAGYLASFPLVAALMGWMAERNWTSGPVVKPFLVMLSGNALCLAIGGAWLAALIGPQKALDFGVTPFLLGGVLKSALASGLIKAAARTTHPA